MIKKLYLECVKNCKKARYLIKITAGDENAGGKVFFRVYQQVQSGFSASRAHIIFSSPILDISPAGERSSAEIHTKVPRWNGKDEIIMSRTRCMWDLWTFLHVHAVMFPMTVAAARRKECINWKFRTNAICFEYMFDASNYLFTWNVCIPSVILSCINRRCNKGRDESKCE